MLALDTSALVGRFLAGPAQVAVVTAMDAHEDWCASALAITEALLLVERLDVDSVSRSDLRRALHDDWQRINVVPVDERCLDRAAELGRQQPVRIADAIHLAAADRLPHPVTYCTLDPRQIPVALALGFDVASR